MHTDPLAVCDWAHCVAVVHTHTTPLPVPPRAVRPLATTLPSFGQKKKRGRAVSPVDATGLAIAFASHRCGKAPYFPLRRGDLSVASRGYERRAVPVAAPGARDTESVVAAGCAKGGGNWSHGVSNDMVHWYLIEDALDSGPKSNGFPDVAPCDGSLSFPDLGEAPYNGTAPVIVYDAACGVPTGSKTAAGSTARETAPAGPAVGDDADRLEVTVTAALAVVRTQCELPRVTGRGSF